jgi:hypothetical protein
MYTYNSRRNELIVSCNSVDSCVTLVTRLVNKKETINWFLLSNSFSDHNLISPLKINKW